MIRQRVVDECARLVCDKTDGLSPADMQSILYQRGLSIMEAVLVTRALFQLSLGMAKEIVSSHQAWRAEAEAAVPIYDAALQMLEDIPFGQAVI